MSGPEKLSPEALDILAFSRVADLRDLAKETELMCMRSTPEPSLDVEIEQLSTDAEERQKQLVLLWQAERKLRLRAQDSLRAALDLIVDG